MSKRSLTLFYNMMELTVNEPAKHSYVVNNRTFYLLAKHAYCKYNDLNWSTPLHMNGFPVYMQGDVVPNDAIKDGEVIFSSIIADRVVTRDISP